MPQTFTYRLRCGTLRTEADMSGIWGARIESSITEDCKRVRVHEPSQKEKMQALDTHKNNVEKTAEARETGWRPHALAEHYRSNQDKNNTRISNDDPEDAPWNPHSLRNHFDLIESTPQGSRKTAKAETRKVVQTRSKEF